ncbi:MAG: clostripain-related cysteine peptidase [Candidatus Cloacimonadota bacterium]|nr:clostripain-related cysteine peptidase [Candidatus Cloacimonadota bacterium]
MKSVWIFICLFFIFLSSLLFAAPEWTVLVYMAADNTLFNAASDDINEMESVNYSDSVKIIVQVDPKDEQSSHFNFSTARRYLITYDENPNSIGSILLNDLGEINSANPDEISDFANWGFSTYPSKKRMLILWDHGNGWRKDDEGTKYVCSDTQAGSNISVANGELNQAISNINYHLNILAFDACLMQMPEVIGEVYEYCDFVIGSEEEVPEDGLYYGDSIYPQCGIFNFLAENPTCSPIDFSSKIVEQYINSYLLGYQIGGNISMSAINTSYFNEFQNGLANFTKNFSDTLYNDIYCEIFTNIDSDYIFNSSIDIYQFFSELKNYEEFQEPSNEMLSAIDSMIVHSIAVYNNEIVSDIGRMSIYFPQSSIRFFSNWLDRGYYQLSFVQVTRWDRFLNFYLDDDNQAPFITNFSIISQKNLVQFLWHAIDPSFIKYTIQYNPGHDSLYIPIHDSTYIYSQNYITTLPSGTYNFILTAIDEFENKSCVWKTAIISDESVFKFFPNPYLVSNAEAGKFIFSTVNSGKAEIFIYNFGGELVQKLECSCEKYSTCLIEFVEVNIASGIYFCLLKTGSRTDVLKLAIIR